MAQKPNLPQFTGDAKTWAQQLVSQLDPYFARLQGEQTEGPLLPRFTQATLPDAGKYAASGANGYSRLVWIEDSTPDGGQLYYSDGTDWHAVVDQETLVDYVSTVLAGYVQSVTASTGVSVDNTDPQNPIVSNTGVLSVSGSDLIEVDNTDPQNPGVGRKAIAHIGLNKNINNADSPGEALLCGFDSAGDVDPTAPFKWRAGNTVITTDPVELDSGAAGHWYIVANSGGYAWGGVKSAVLAQPYEGGWRYRYYDGGTVEDTSWSPSSTDYIIGELYMDADESVETGFLYDVAHPVIGTKEAIEEAVDALFTGLASQSSTTNRCQILPGGIVIQYGSTQVTTSSNFSGVYEGSVSVTFPVAFPNQMVSIVATAGDVGGGGKQEMVNAGANLTTATLRGQSLVSGATMWVRYIAMGV